MLLAIKNMGGESAQAWRTVLDDLITRWLRRLEFLIVGRRGSTRPSPPSGMACQTALHGLQAQEPVRAYLHDEITTEYKDMICAATPGGDRSASQSPLPQMEA